MASKKNVKLNLNAPTLLVDGNGTGINSDNTVSIVFFQAQGETENEIIGNVVSSIRMTAGQTEQLRNSLNEVLEKLPESEEEKK